MIFQSMTEYRQAGFAPRVCVIGSGPAGMTTALELGRAGIPVVMLEAGGMDFSAESQEFYKGQTLGDPYFELDVTRLRYLGGSSNHWAGWCRVMDAHDFEPKSWVPDSGWPIRRSDLEPYLGKVHDILGLEDWRPDLPVSPAIRWVQLIKSDAVRFGEKFRGELEANTSIAVVLNTYVTELHGDGKTVTGAKLWSAGAAAGDFTAPYFVICTGGLENSRLLMWSNQRSNGGVVPHAAALGRYWMEHPQFEGGTVILSGKDTFELDSQNEAFFSPSPEAMAERGIMNAGIRLIALPYAGMKKVLADLACTAPSLAEWMADAAGFHLRCAAQLYVGWEQAPLASNHVALSATETDAAGVPRLELHWEKTELERRTLHESLRLFGETMATLDYGRVRIESWVAAGDYPGDEELAGHHHMGGTRMGTDPEKSVVDADCKVHGMANLFIGGSSVFTTSGQCNPTTTIVALALRLASHLVRVTAI